MSMTEAEDIARNKLTPNQGRRLMAVQSGLPVHQIPAEDWKLFDELELVEIVNFTNLRASAALPGLLTTEFGNKVVQVLQYDWRVRTSTIPMTEMAEPVQPNETKEVDKTEETPRKTKR